jgi:hypothetical protein
MRDVPTPVDAREVTLAPDSGPTDEQFLQWNLPESGQPRGERGGRHMASAQAAISIAWNECDCVDVGARQGFPDDARSNRREVSPPTFLPGRHERPRV